MATAVPTTTPGVGVFTPTSANRRRPHASRETAATGLQSLKSDPLTTVDGICRRIHESAIGVVHYARYRSDSIHLNRPRSDSNPIIVHSLIGIFVCSRYSRTQTVVSRAHYAWIVPKGCTEVWQEKHNVVSP